MAAETKIQWTDHTFNPWRGCTKVSPGCAHCYAETQSKRNPAVLGEWGPDGTRVLAAEAQWREPLKWDEAAARLGRRARVFCASLADVFERWPGQMTDHRQNPLNVVTGIEGGAVTERRPFTLDNARSRLWKTIRATPSLTWQLLTKRPENIRDMMPKGDWPNVWLGASVESADHLPRADALTDAPQRVPVRFLSVEPLLAPLDLSPVLGGVQWVIVGGESGGKARPCHLSWCRALVRQCRQAGVACFVKQLGRRVMDSGEDVRAGQLVRWTSGAGPEINRVHDPKGGNADEWPADLRVREFPSGRQRP